jgi:hypothetical protein
MTVNQDTGMYGGASPFARVAPVDCMERMNRCLEGFRTVDLKHLEALKLMRRYDRKFVFHRDQLITVWSFLRQNYQVLEIAENKIFTYDNLYYDTTDLFFYHQHHNKKMNRYKVRCRKYIDTDQCFFEIKFKNNKKKTIKSRFLMADGASAGELTDKSRDFIHTIVSANGGTCFRKGIGPSLRIGFNRVTFADFVQKERLTFDTNLTYTDMGCNRREIGNLVIAELKSENPSGSSPFSQCLRDLRITSSGFSKYCIGIALMERGVKYNRFKGRLAKVENLM